jgi:ABC-type uncharacterized transport system substrate-binding protein
MNSSFRWRVLVLLALAGLATAAAAQSKSLPRIGWVISTSAEGGRHIVEAMRAGLADEGLADGRDVVLDVRYAAGRLERYPELFADLMRSPAQVLAAAGYAGISAARDASGGRIPVAAYFCGNEVKAMVESFARPGGNISGVSCLSTELAVNIAAFREFADAGGVMTYGASNIERIRQQARYAAKMIRGVKPADLPIDQPMRFEFVINQKAATALGVTIPKELLLRADDVLR